MNKFLQSSFIIIITDDVENVGISPQTTVNVLSTFTVEFNHSTTLTTRASTTFTPTISNNIAYVVVACTMRGRGGTQTWTLECEEATVDVLAAKTSTFNTVSASLILQNSGFIPDVSAGAHTWDLRTKSSASSQIALGECIISVGVIK